jgi:Zn-dependent M28 family amino/carboxypeptidase
MKPLLNYYLIGLTCLTILISCSYEKIIGNDANEDIAGFNEDSLALHISDLSSDAFLGRKPFTEGETKTINYLKDHFSALGLEPGNGVNYFQEVPMVRITTKADNSMQVKSAKGNFSLKGFDDYVIWTDRTASKVLLNDNEVVFAGYGVVAPEYNWNDYEGLDVKGKIVLVLVNDPGYNAGDPNLFKGKAMTYYGRWTYKFEEAARQGAKGCLIVHETQAASYGFQVVQNNWNASRLRLDDRASSNKQPYCDVIGWVSGPTAQKLLEAAGLNKDVIETADKPGFRGRSLGIRLSTSMQVTAEYNTSNNVVARITGSKKPNEYIIYTAHWDHLGIGKPDEKGDSIYNGALDNASATAGLLELAKAFKRSKHPPERSIIFLAVTAEEQGLWGSAYYAQNPIYPLNKTLANINMDGLNNYGKTHDIIVVGQGQSELEDYLESEVKKVNRVITYETRPEAGSYYRSDHFNFAKVGVPALYTSSGIEVLGEDENFGKLAKEDYNTKRYHRPSDHFDDKWKLDGAIDDLQLLYKIGQKLAATKTWPRWKPGSEFKAVREESLR